MSRWLHGYTGMLRSRPYLTNCCTGGTVMLLGDALAQVLWESAGNCAFKPNGH